MVFGSALSTKSYLVVDDFGGMRSSLRSMLSLFGASDIDLAKNGADAIQMLEKKRYDVVLCDYNLGPGRDGQQVLEEARHRNLISNGTAFIMITAENTASMVLGAIEYEPDSYLSKPFTKDLLGSRLERILVKKSDLQPIDAALEQKDYPRALQLLEQRIAAKPKNLGELIRLKGEVCLKSGAYEEAAVVYEGILAVREMAWARLGLGKVHYGLKQYEAAKDIFQDLVVANDRYTSAYDWLARCQKALGDSLSSQKTLAAAVKISPKAILRQNALGEIALENKDYKAAESAFGHAVELGRHSIHKHPKMYTRLVESKISNEECKDKSGTFKLIEQMKREYRGNREAEIYAAMAAATAHRGVGEVDKAMQSMAAAEQLYEQFASDTNPDLTLSLAKLNADFGEEEKAVALYKTAVKNNHDDEEFLRNLETSFTESGLSESVKELVYESRKEIVQLNNRGAGLVTQGKIEEALGLFEKAAEGMSGNKTINLNAAIVSIMHMERHGLDMKLISKSRQYLDRVKKLDPDYAGLPKLQERFKKLLKADR